MSRVVFSLISSYGWLLTKVWENWHRVGQGLYSPFPPSELCMIVSHHTAQALQKQPLS